MQRDLKRILSWKRSSYDKKEGYGDIRFLPSSDYAGEDGCTDKKFALMSRVFEKEKLSQYRKANKTTYLVDDDATALSMRPIWDKYIDIYEIRSVYVLNWDLWSFARSKDTGLNVKNFSVFTPQTNV